METPKFGLIEMYIHGEPHWVDNAIAEKEYDKYCIDCMQKNEVAHIFEDFLKGTR